MLRKLPRKLVRKLPWIPGALRRSAGTQSLALSLTLGALVILNVPQSALAGDILRGGFTGRSGGSSGVPASGVNTPPRLTQAQNRKQNILSRTSGAVKSVQAMQQTARNIAVSGPNFLKNPKTGEALPTVPDGLTPGGFWSRTAFLRGIHPSPLTPRLGRTHFVPPKPKQTATRL